MSPITWTTSEGNEPNVADVGQSANASVASAPIDLAIASCVAPAKVAVCRVVEAQHVRVTRQWVKDDADQALLESLIETAKPTPEFFEDAEGNHVDLSGHHYLLRTPFRYRPPLRGGSRFGGVMDPPVWYAAEHVATALAERSYHLIREMHRSPNVTATSQHEWADFSVNLQTNVALDLCKPLDTQTPGLPAAFTAPGDYTACQQLAKQCRQKHIHAIGFPSARDPESVFAPQNVSSKQHPSAPEIASVNAPARGKNWAVLHPLAFASPQVDLTTSRTWAVLADRDSVRIARKNALGLEPAYRFNAEVFCVKGQFPDPLA